MKNSIPDHAPVAYAREQIRRRKIAADWKKRRERARRIKWFMFAFAMLLLVPSVTLAAPVFAFALGPAGLGLLTGTTLTVVSSILGFAATTAATYLIGALFAPEEPGDPGVKGEMQAGETVAQSFIVGTYATAGSLVYAGSWGSLDKTPNAYLVQVIAVGDLPYTALNNKGWCWNRKIDINTGATQTIGGHNVGHKVTNLQGDMWIKFKDGTQTTQDPYLAAIFNSIGTRPMNANFIGRGRAYVIVTTKYDADAFDDFPAPLLSFDGIKLYDPRKDSTNGGTGTHRYGIYSTYEFSANNKVIHYNGKRGIFWGDNEEWMFGGQALPAYHLDNSTWFAAMNACDADVALAAGGTEKVGRMGAEISCDMDYTDFSETLDKCTNARTMEYCGVYKTYVGAPGASVYNFTDDDIVATLDKDNKFIPSTSDMFNAIVGAYPNPDEAWAMKPIRKASATFLTEDNGQRFEQNIALPYVTKGTRAQRILQAMLRESRRNKTHLIALGPNAFRLEPLDVVAWTSTQFQYSAKRFIIGNFQPFRELGYVIAALRETDATDNAWVVGDETAEDITPTDDLPPASQLLVASYSAYSIKNNAGVGKIPAIKATWPIDGEMVDCEYVRYQIRLKDTVDTDLPIKTVPFDEGKFVISEGLLKQEIYQIRTMIIPYGDRPVAWGSWVDVTTPSVGPTEVDDTPPAKVTPAPTMQLMTKIDRGGAIRQYLLVNWTPLADNKVTYTVRDSDGTNIQYFPGDPKVQVPVKFGESHTIRVIPISRFGVRGPESDPATGVTMPIAKKAPADGAIPAVGAVTISGNHRRNVLDWGTVNRDTYPDFGYSEIEASNDGSTGWAVVKRLTASGWTHDGLNNAQSKYYRVRHFDTSGNPGAYSSVVNATTIRIGNDLDDYQDFSILKQKFARDDMLVEKKVKVAGKKVETNSKANSFEAIKGKTTYTVNNPSGKTVWVNCSFKLSVYASGSDRDRNIASMTASAVLKSGNDQWELGSAKTNKKGYDTKSIGKTITIQGGLNVPLEVVVNYSCSIPPTSGPAGAKKEASVYISGNITTQVMRVP